MADSYEVKGANFKDSAFDNMKKPFKPSNMRRWCLFYGIVTTVILALLLILLIVFIALYAQANNAAASSSQSSSSSNVCLTPDCVNLASLVINSLDESIDPCEDFYNFSCRNWERTRPEPPVQVGGLFEIDPQNDLAIENLLSEVKSTDVNAVRKAKSFFDSCNNQTAINIAGGAPLVNFIRDELGGWALANIIPENSFSFSQLANYHIHQPGKSGRDNLKPFFAYQIAIDDIDATNPTFRLKPSGTTISADLAIAYQTPVLRSRLLTYMTNSVYLLGGKTGNMTVITAAMNDVIDFETKLIQLSTKSKIVHLSIRQLTEQFQIPELDWLAYFKAMFTAVTGSASSNIFTDDSIFQLTDQGYLSNLTTLVTNTPASTLNNYAKWIVAKNFIPFLGGEFASVFTNFGLSGKLSCVKLVTTELPFAISRLYTPSQVQSGTRTVLTEMVTDIMTAFKQRTRQHDWLDEETRQAVIDKVNAVNHRIAYPDEIFDDEYLNNFYADVNPNESTLVQNFISTQRLTVKNEFKFFLTVPVNATLWTRITLYSPPTFLNAFYYASLNEFVYLEGILHSPAFRAGWPDYYLYGAIGAITGHELTHGFDTNGRQFDLNGNRRMWWTNDSVKAFDERVSCFVDQYNNYKLNELSVNGQLTIGENIADSGGLETSFRAYKNRIGRGRNFDLPILSEKYTQDQLFYIAYAQLYCSKFSQAGLQAALSDVHSPGPIRVLGTVSNNEEFAQTFNCKAGARYNPEKKCNIW